MRAAIYSRFSTDRQNESSIADQVRVCSEYARASGLAGRRAVRGSGHQRCGARQSPRSAAP